MTAFGVMQTRIADEIVRDDLPNQIKYAINDAILQWEAKRFLFNEKRRRILTVAAQEYYDLAYPTLLDSDGSALTSGEKVIELDFITYASNSGNPNPLTQRTQGWMDDNQNSTGTYTGRPDSYTIYGDQLRIFPVPDAVYTLSLSAHVRLGPFPLVNTSDTNAWMTDAEAVIRQYAKMLIYRDNLRDEKGKSNAAEGLQEAEWALTRKYAAKAHTGPVRPWI